MNPTSPLARLLAAPMRAGQVVWIGIRPARRLALVPMTEVELKLEAGVVGDHGQSRNRQVTLIQAEHLAAIGGYLGRPPIEPGLLRRNIVVRGINLVALKDRTFRVGTAVLEDSGACHPCSRMEEILGAGGYNAVRGHGGITARVVTGGQVRVGDLVEAVTSCP